MELCIRDGCPLLTACMCLSGRPAKRLIGSGYPRGSSWQCTLLKSEQWVSDTFWYFPMMCLSALLMRHQDRSGRLLQFLWPDQFHFDMSLHLLPLLLLKANPGTAAFKSWSYSTGIRSRRQLNVHEALIFVSDVSCATSENYGCEGEKQRNGYANASWVGFPDDHCIQALVIVIPKKSPANPQKWEFPSKKNLLCCLWGLFIL